MTDTDTTALQERLWDAIFEARDLPGKTGEAPTESIVAAVLPIVESAVKRGQAEALRDAATGIEKSDRNLPGMTVSDAVRSLRFRADDLEEETQLPCGCDTPLNAVHVLDHYPEETR